MCVCFLGVSVAVVLTSGCSSSSGRKSAKPGEAKAKAESKCSPAQKLFDVKVGGKVGFIDRTGKLVITPQFDGVAGFTEGLAWVCLGKCSRAVSLWLPGDARNTDESKYGFIDESGKYVVNPTYDEVYPFSEGLAAVCSGDCAYDAASPRKWGFVDKTGKVAVPLQFGAARAFNEGLAAVCVGSCTSYVKGRYRPEYSPERFEGKWGYIDAKGAFVINPQFDEAYYFENGIAQVTIGKGADAKSAYIDKTGKFVWNPTN